MGISNDLLTSESENCKSMGDVKSSFSSPNASFSLDYKKSSFSESGSSCSAPKFDLTKAVTECTQHSYVFSASSDSPGNPVITSNFPSQLPFSTPLVNHKYPNMCQDPPSLRRHFHNLSLRIASKASDVDSPNHLSSDSENISRPADDDDTLDHKANSSKEYADSFEALMAQLRPSPPVSSTKPGVQGDSSFVVSDDTPSEAKSSDDLSFYHRIENFDMRKSIK